MFLYVYGGKNTHKNPPLPWLPTGQLPASGKVLLLLWCLETWGLVSFSILIEGRSWKWHCDQLGCWWWDSSLAPYEPWSHAAMEFVGSCIDDMAIDGASWKLYNFLRCIVSEPLFLPNGLGGTKMLGEEHEDDGWLVRRLAEVFLQPCCRKENLLQDAQKRSQEQFRSCSNVEFLGQGHMFCSPDRNSNLFEWTFEVLCMMETPSVATWFFWMRRRWKKDQ